MQQILTQQLAWPTDKKHIACRVTAAAESLCHKQTTPLERLFAHATSQSPALLIR